MRVLDKNYSPRTVAAFGSLLAAFKEATCAGTTDGSTTNVQPVALKQASPNS